MTILATYVSQNPSTLTAMQRVRPATKARAEVRNLAVVRALDERTSDLLDGLRQFAEAIPERRPHSDGSAFSPKRRARNIAVSYLANAARARNVDLRGFDGHLIDLKAGLRVGDDVRQEIEALNERRAALASATSELDSLVAAVARGDQQSADLHRNNILEITDEVASEQTHHAGCLRQL